jgi:hypothetical protein
MLNFGVVMRAAGENAQDERIREDLTKFQSYLDLNKPGKKWQTGPTRIDSEEIRKAYEKLRFYYVYSSPPTPPGAPLPELLEEYERKMDEYQKQFISLTFRIDEQGEMKSLQEEDYTQGYNQGLMRVTTDDEARICAAAILSLHISDRVGPEIVTAKEITVTRNEKGWSCSMLRENAFQGAVLFDNDGKCVSVTKTYMGALPS